MQTQTVSNAHFSKRMEIELRKSGKWRDIIETTMHPSVFRCSSIIVTKMKEVLCSLREKEEEEKEKERRREKPRESKKLPLTSFRLIASKKRDTKTERRSFVTTQLQ